MGRKGTVGEIRMLVGVNATVGGARVRIDPPEGAPGVDTTSGLDERFPLALGVWRVRVEPTGKASGLVRVLAVRG